MTVSPPRFRKGKVSGLNAPGVRGVGGPTGGGADMQIEKSPFLNLDKQQVIGFLKDTGSRDPDVLHTQKAILVSAAKFPKLVGIYLMVLGALMTVMILTAFIGIPLIGLGWWLRRRGIRNLDTVESGYTEYVAVAA
jgi:hypothetical protein